MLKGVTLSHSQKRSSQAGLVNGSPEGGMKERERMASVRMGCGSRLR